MRKAGLWSVILGVCLGCMSAFSPGSAISDTIELKFAQPFSPKHTLQVKVFEPWAKELNRLTGGKVKVTIFPGGALGKTTDHYILAEKGIADISYGLHDYTPGRFPLTSVFELPFMVPSATKTSIAMWKMYERYPAFQNEYRNVKLLALFCHPAGHFNTTNKPIERLTDFKGLKFRTANPHVTRALKMFDAVPVNMPVTDIFLSLEKGVIDGTVLNWEGNFVFKLAGLLTYATEVDFYTMTMMVVMNKRKWESLPEDVQQAIDQTTGMAMSEKAGRVYDETRPVMKKLCLKKGMQVIKLPPEETRKLKNLTMPLRKKWVEEMASRNLPGRDVLQSSLELIE